MIREGKFLIIVTDGIFDEVLMELPSEELADTITFELQRAWDQGVAWGTNRTRRELDRTGYDNEIRKEIDKLKAKNQEELAIHRLKTSLRHARMEKVEEARRWKNVLSWKNKTEE